MDSWSVIEVCCLQIFERLVLDNGFGYKKGIKIIIIIAATVDYTFFFFYLTGLYESYCFKWASFCAFIATTEMKKLKWEINSLVNYLLEKNFRSDLFDY